MKLVTTFEVENNSTYLILSCYHHYGDQKEHAHKWLTQPMQAIELEREKIRDKECRIRVYTLHSRVHFHLSLWQ